MKMIETRSAAGHILAHDLTQIIPGAAKGARFKKGHIVTKEDIPVLLSMGKQHLFVWEQRNGFLHENEAAQRLAALCQNKDIVMSQDKAAGSHGFQQRRVRSAHTMPMEISIGIMTDGV